MILLDARSVQAEGQLMYYERISNNCKVKSTLHGMLSGINTLIRNNDSNENVLLKGKLQEQELNVKPFSRIVLMLKNYVSVVHSVLRALWLSF